MRYQHLRELGTFAGSVSWNLGGKALIWFAVTCRGGKSRDRCDAEAGNP
jgi:hypothetical protein